MMSYSDKNATGTSKVLPPASPLRMAFMAPRLFDISSLAFLDQKVNA